MMSEQTETKAEVTTPGEREIHVERTFDAPRERVFAAYTDPELIPQWWGPYGTTTVVKEFDPRAGGRWRFEWEGLPGHVSVETATFEDLGDGRTKVISDTVFHTAEERDGMLESGMERGMNETFARLDTLLAEQATA